MDNHLLRKYIEIGGKKICYFSDTPFAGRPTLILLHGLSANHTTWTGMLDFFRENKWNVIAPDLRGHGLSDKTKNRNLYRIPVFTNDLAEIIREEKITNPILVGYSFGGYIALDYAVKHSDNMAGLVLVSTNHANPFKYHHLSLLGLALSFIVNLLGWLLIWQKRKEYKHFDQTISAGYWESTLKGFTTMPFSVNLWMLSEIPGINFENAIASIKCPTLLIRGKGDLFLTEKEIKDMAGKIRGAELKTLDNPSHFLASHYQDLLAGSIIDFVRKLS